MGHPPPTTQTYCSPPLVVILCRERSEGFVEGQGVELVLELLVGGGALLLEGGDLLVEGAEAVFLGVELAGVAGEEGFFFGAALEGFHVFAQAVLVGGDGGDLGLATLDLLVEGDDLLVEVEDGLKGGEGGGAGVGVLQKEGELVLGAVDEADVFEVGVALADVEVDGFRRAGGEFEAVGSGGGLGGCGGWFAVAVGAVEGPARADGVLEDDGAWVGGGVADDRRCARRGRWRFL